MGCFTLTASFQINRFRNISSKHIFKMIMIWIILSLSSGFLWSESLHCHWLWSCISSPKVIIKLKLHLQFLLAPWLDASHRWAAWTLNKAVFGGFTSVTAADVISSLSSLMRHCSSIYNQPAKTNTLKHSCQTKAVLHCRPDVEQVALSIKSDLKDEWMCFIRDESKLNTLMVVTLYIPECFYTYCIDTFQGLVKRCWTTFIYLFFKYVCIFGLGIQSQ